MKLSVFTNVHDSSPRLLTLEWDGIVQVLSQPVYTPCAPCPRGNKCSHKEGELFSPVEYKQGTSRGAKNVTRAYFLVYDLDHMTGAQLQSIGSHLEGIQSFTYSTHSDAPDLDDRCFRLLVNICRPLTPLEWSQVYFRFAKKIGISDFGGRKDISGMFYTPSTPQGSEFFTAEEKGDPLSVEEFLAVTPNTTNTPDESPIDYESFRDRVKSLANKKFEIGSDEQCALGQLYTDALAGLPLRKDGSRESALKSITLSLLSTFGAKYKDTIRYFLRASCVAMGEDSPGKTFVDMLDYKLDRDEELGESNYQEKLQRQETKTREAIAILPASKVEYPSTGDEVLDAFNRSFFLGWNAQKNQLNYYKETEDEVIPINKESIVTETRPIRKRISEDKTIPGFQFWEGSTNRRHYDRVHFAPRQTLPPNEYNLFKGYGLEPKEIDYPLFKEFWRNVICNGDENIYRYMVTWVAQMLQRPYDPPGIALVLQSDIHGTGKGTFVEAIGRLVGKAHFVTESDPAKLLEGFSGHLEKTILINIDESHGSLSRKLHDAMKNLITAPTRQIEHKGMARFTCNNYGHLIITTNNNDAVRLDPSDRRFSCFGVSTSRVGDREYFTKLYEEIRSPAMCGLLKDLLEFDLEKDGVDLRNIPETKARKTMRQTSISEVAVFWQMYLQLTQEKACNLQLQHQEYLMTKPRYAASLAQFTAEIKDLCPSGKESMLSSQAGRKMLFQYDIVKARRDFEIATQTTPEWLEETPSTTSKVMN